MDYNLLRGSGTASGTDTYTVDLSVGDTALVTNGIYIIEFTNGNTGASTLNINGIGASGIKKEVSTDLSAGDIDAGSIHYLIYDGTNFQVAYKLTDFANQAEVDAGTVANKAVAPSTLANVIQDGDYLYAELSGTDTYTATLTPTLTAYGNGQWFLVKVNSTNTGASTLNIDTLGAKSIVRENGDAVIAGDLDGSAIVALSYDGTNFLLQNGRGDFTPFIKGAGANSVKLISNGSNTVTGAKSSILAGINNTVSGDNSGVVNGEDNDVTEDLSSVLSGQDHEIGTPLGGLANFEGAIIRGGALGIADRWGVDIYAPGGINGIPGGSQEAKMILTRTGTDAQVYDLNAPNSGALTNSFMFLDTDNSFVCMVKIIGTQTGGGAGTVGDTYSRISTVTIKNVAGVVSLVGAVNDIQQVNDAGAAAWVTQINATGSGTSSRLRIQCTGEVNKDIHWVAIITALETRW